MSKPKKKSDPFINPKSNYGKQLPGYKEEVKKRNAEKQREKFRERNEFFKNFL